MEKDCIFCKIAAGEVPANKVYENEFVVAFPDIHPTVPGHTILIPKAHYRWFWELPDNISDQLFRAAKELAKKLKEEFKTDYVHLSIVGKDVPHVHVHLMPRKFGEKLPAA
jgi:histidine triad (HIT) family protein